VDSAEFGGLGRIRWTWQNSAEVTDVADVVDIAVEIGRQNMAEYGGERQIAVDCRRLRQSRDRSLVAECGNRWTYVRCHGGIP
jgi:hypothetical protein